MDDETIVHLIFEYLESKNFLESAKVLSEERGKLK